MSIAIFGVTIFCHPNNYIILSQWAGPKNNGVYERNNAEQYEIPNIGLDINFKFGATAFAL